MRVMVIETLHDPAAVYARFAAKGRMLPEGVTYLDSWVEEGGGRCFQLMDCASLEQLQPWLDAWSDLADFEIVPVTDSTTAAKRFKL
jgi:hypothetical protein